MPRVCLVVSVDDVTTPTGLVRRRHTMHDSTGVAARDLWGRILALPAS